ncbi:MAG: MBOAT family protein, partial [Planctomycetes bacterium]|nr:MBOAT family protein [Planctomycetota bacterium]
MIFTEPRFLGFFLVVFAVHWLLRSHALRKHWLLAASYAFYAAWDWRFLFLIFASTVVDWVAALQVVRARRVGGGARRWLILSLVANLGVLGFFKYFNFFAYSAWMFFGWLGLPVSKVTLDIVLPVGISFFTFQTMSYSIDVYRGKLEPTRRFSDFALYVAFFPQLVAGPIVRAVDFLPQLVTPRRIRDVDFRAAYGQFLVGFIKKACIADGVAATVDQMFAAPWAYEPTSVTIAVLLYAVQIYCDFSGYSDMAIATARMLGFELRRNFDAPYFARNITDFWRRWHISLSGWLRDYLYIPLGGNRGSRGFTYRNLMLTMLLGGLWHGAGWNFVIWGGIHGAALVLHREWVRLTRGRRLVPAFVAWASTLSVVLLAWVFFRARSLRDSMFILDVIFTHRTGGRTEVSMWQPFPDAGLWTSFAWVVGPLVVVHWLASRGVHRWIGERVPGLVVTACYAVVTVLALT